MDINFIRQVGVVLFDDFIVDPSTPLLDQLDNLKEDMFQVVVKGKYILDVGWRPSFDPEGAFQILLIKDYEWDSPVYSGVAKTMEALEEQIKLAMLNAD